MQYQASWKNQRGSVLTAISFALILLGSALTTPAASQCNTTCMTATASPFGMVCTVTINPIPPGPPGCTTYLFLSGEMINGAPMNANCSLGADMDGIAMASHTPGQATPATCAFDFPVFFYAYFPSMMSCGLQAPGSITCTVNTSDGLPVELMDFTVDQAVEPSTR